MKNVSLVLILTLVAALGAPSNGQAQDFREEGQWRGFIGVPNGEEFGFSLDVATRGGRLAGVIIPDPVPGERFEAHELEVSDNMVSFVWHPTDLPVRCKLERTDEGFYFGACVQPNGSFGPGVIAPEGQTISQDDLSWERLRRMKQKEDIRRVLDSTQDPRGEKINVGGPEIYALSQGSGSPSVVFISGLGDDLRTWDYVHFDVKDRTHAVSYTRAGLGHSDDAAGKRTMASLVDELHALIQATEAKRPVVLVAHDFGSFIARAYAEAHPAHVGGLVLVDPASEMEAKAYASLDAASWQEYLKRQETLYGLAPAAIGEEFAVYRDVLKKGELAGGSLPDVPTVVVTPTQLPEKALWVGDTEEGLQARMKLQRSMTEGLSWSRHLTSSKSTAYVQREDPDLVIEAVDMVLRQVGRGTR